MRLVLEGRKGPSLAMQKDEWGHWCVDVPDIGAGQDYMLRLGNRDYADPASHWQPKGVHGPSRVVDHSAFVWSDAGFVPPPWERIALYELHAGAFTSQGDLDGVLGKLDHLAELGVNAVEIMPVAQFPGQRNWGYDGVFPFAVQDSYGGPDALKRLVDACHARGLAVFLDVVYNHLGPEGNVLVKFAPYLHGGRHTPWGGGFRYDGEDSAGVRSLVLHNALHWLHRYHMDGLRLDAASCIHDVSREHVLAEMDRRVADYAQATGRRIVLVAETDENDAAYVRPRNKGGHGLDAGWNFDFHHCLHAALTSERQGFFADFGRVSHVAEAMEHGFVLRGQESVYYRGPHGGDCAGCPGTSFVVYAQNHDMVGNRPGGERLASLVSFEAAKLAAAVVLCAPFVPLLFMGEEWAETRPFLYFTSHGDAGLNRAVAAGRRREYQAFGWGPYADDPAWAERVTDPCDPEAFAASRLDWSKPGIARHRAMLAWHKALLALRCELPALAALDRDACSSWSHGDMLYLARGNPGPGQVFCCFNFGGRQVALDFTHLEGGGAWPDKPGRAWVARLDSAHKAWDGPGSLLPGCMETLAGNVLRPQSAVILEWAPEQGQPLEQGGNEEMTS